MQENLKTTNDYQTRLKLIKEDLYQKKLWVTLTCYWVFIDHWLLIISLCYKV